MVITLRHFYFPYGISSRLWGRRTALPYHFDVQQVGSATPFLTFDLKASTISLLVKARDDDRGKHP
jgi:hypothetical protein